MNRLEVAVCVMAALPVAAVAQGTAIAVWTDGKTIDTSLSKDAAARAAWHKIVPKKYIKTDWVYNLAGNFEPAKIMTEGGHTYAVGNVCKPHDCAAYNAFYVIEPGGHKAAGAVLIVNGNVVVSQEYFGKTDELQHEWLRELIVASEHDMGINGVVK